MRRLSTFAAMACLMAAAPAAFGQIIYDNKSSITGGTNSLFAGIVTDPGAGAGGFDASVLVTPDTTLGSGHQGAVRLADNFTVPAGQIWTITGVVNFGYLTGATAPGVTASNMRFFNGAPNAGGTVIAGDTTTNLLVAGSNTFLNIYRTTVADIATATTRRIQTWTSTLTAPLVLGEGTYWFDYSNTGSSFVPPLQVVPRAGGIATGDALQSVDSGVTYTALLDGGSLVAKGIPFQLLGSVAPIPEPTSMALVGLGAVGFAVRRWRKK